MAESETTGATSPGDGRNTGAAEQYRRQFDAVTRNVSLALFVMDERQQCVYMNPAAESLTGFTLAEVQGRLLHDVIHHTRPDGSPYPLDECPIDRALPRNVREHGEETFVHRSGRFYPVAFTASPIIDGGRPVGTVVEVREITEERRARQEREELLTELELERSRLSTIFDQAPALMATLRGPHHVFEMANRAYFQLVGHRELIGKPVREALPEVETQGFLDLLDGVYRSGETVIGTEARIALQREPFSPLEERYVNFVYQPLTDADGQVSGILAHGVDVTDLVHAREQSREQARELAAQTRELREQAGRLEHAQVELEAANEDLQQLNQELVLRTRAAEAASREAEEARAVLDALHAAAPMPTALVDRDLRFHRINESLARIYGMAPDEVIGRTIHEVVPHYADVVAPYYERVLRTGEPIRNAELSVALEPDDDTLSHFLVNYFPVNVSGEVIGVGLIALDVTERRAAEEARREQASTVENLHRIGRSVAAELDQGTIVQAVTDAATSLTGARFGAFFYNVTDQAGERYTLYTTSGVPREAFSRFPMPRNTPVFEPTFYGEGVVRSDDITLDPRYGRMAPHHGMPPGHLPVRSYLAVPVLSHTGEVLGGLFFGHEEVGVFDERHERLAVGIASWAALAMDNARLFEAEYRARAEAERANRAKAEFLATMSHELRTPLNAMIGYADLLISGIPEPIPDRARQRVERIAVSARHLQELIEEILTFSRLEAGEEKVEPGDVWLGALVGEVQALVEPLALQKGIQFHSELPEELPRLRTDARKLRQILVNLLGNAIKFTSEGAVSLQLTIDSAAVEFRVMDTGRGIAPEHQEKVFEPFWQVEAGATRTAEGTGLGLSVSRRLARLLGGDIAVESGLGEGSTFIVRIPTEAPPIQQEAAAETG